MGRFLQSKQWDDDSCQVNDGTILKKLRKGFAVAAAVSRKSIFTKRVLGL